MTEKAIYVPGTSVKTIPTKHGDMLKVSCKAEEVAQFLTANANEGGWVTLLITKRERPDEKGRTHSVKLDTWKPDASKAKRQFVSDVAAAVSDEDIPF